MKYLARLRQYPLTTLFTVLVLGCIILFSFGFRLGPGLTIVRSGTLVLEGVPARSVIYIDSARRTVAGGDTLRLALMPGAHDVIIDTPGAYPWEDLVTITGTSDTLSHPILVNKVPNKELVPATEVAAAKTAFASYQFPIASAPLARSGGCVLLSVQGSQIIGTPTTTPTCTPPSYMCTGTDCSPTIIFAPPFPLGTLSAYPGRDDVFIASYGTLVSVIELDPRKPQYVAPLYEGTRPAAIPWVNNSILVSDAGNFYVVHLP